MATIYCVLGMHKSGTTLVSQILHQSGINMGSFDLDRDYDQGNKYERSETQNLNKRILGCGNTHSLSVNKPVRIKDIDESYFFEAQKIVATLDTLHNAWGFKDPRTCLLVDFWHSVIPETKYIHVIRHPIEVWHYYKSRLSKDSKFIDYFSRCINSLRVWYLYNREIAVFSGSLTNGNLVSIEYSRLMTNDVEFDRLEHFAGQKLSDTRDLSKYRHRKQVDAIYTLAIIFCRFKFRMNIPGLYSRSLT